MNVTYSVGFTCIACKYFSRWRLKIFPGGNHPRTHDLWRLTVSSGPYPTWRGYLQLFFRQSDRKGCRIDYLDGFFRFGGGRQTFSRLVRRGFTTLLQRFTYTEWSKILGPRISKTTAHDIRFETNFERKKKWNSKFTDIIFWNENIHLKEIISINSHYHI